jgi:hypothetical protein
MERLTCKASHERFDGAEKKISLTASIGPCLVRQFSVQNAVLYRRVYGNFRMNVIPSHPGEAFGVHQSLLTRATGHPGFLLQSVTSFLRPGLCHYYGIFCHLAPR